MHAVQSEGPGLREAKKATTRHDLTRAARRLALEHGLDGVTVERVCSEVGVSPRTFFNYFPSKDAAVVGEVPPVGDEASRAVFLAGGPTGDDLVDAVLLLDPSAALERGAREELTALLELTRREPRLLAVSITRGAAQEQELAELVAARRGADADDPSSATAATVAAAVARRACRTWHEDATGAALREHLALAASQVCDLVTARARTTPPTDLTDRGAR